MFKKSLYVSFALLIVLVRLFPPWADPPQEV